MTALFRESSGASLSVDYLNCLIKSMLRFTMEKSKKYDEKRAEEVMTVDGRTAEEVEVYMESGLTKCEKLDYDTLKVSRVITAGMQKCVTSSDEGVEEIFAAAEAYKKWWNDRKQNSQDLYWKRKKELRRKGAERENRMRQPSRGRKNCQR